MNFFQASNLQNLDLLLVGITIAAIGILGFIVFFKNRKSITNKTFLSFAILTIAYGSFNYISYQVSSPEAILWFLRLTIFFATLHAFSFFQLTYVFPGEQKNFSKIYKFLLVPIVLITAIITLTPFVFSRIDQVATEGVTNPERAPGIVLFGAIVSFLVAAGIFLLIKKTINAQSLAKHQFQLISAGTVITFVCIITFNFVFPVVFNNLTLLPLAPIFFLPFIFLTAYAIIRYRFLDIKVMATEILTFVLAVVTLVEVLFAQSVQMLAFRVAIFGGVLGFGILLIRSVRKEVEQREELQKLMDNLARANAELKRLDKAKSEFVSIASHQLRTPLTAVKGYLSLMLEGSYGKLADTLQKPVANLYTSNERLISLVNDLLSLSRLESGKMKLEPKPANLVNIVTSVVDELRVKAKQKGLALVLERPRTELPEMPLDAEKVRNAILNVVDNSIRYTNEGSITVKVERLGGKARITVADTGEGMTPEEMRDLFESFSRGEAGEKLSTEGVGLGLYIAKQFVKMHKGKIWATSEGKGQGSTFFVELPIK